MAELSLEQVWKLGCRGEVLAEQEAKKFERMARNRFYTFSLGMQHATENRDEVRSDATVRGMATELMENPGLERFWLSTEFSRDADGQKVQFELHRRYRP